MVWLVGAAMFAAALYWWLLGHWFARVVVFLVFTLLGLGLVGSLLAGLGGHYLDETWVADLIVALPVAWFASGVPIWVRTKRTAPLNIQVYPRSERFNG